MDKDRWKQLQTLFAQASKMPAAEQEEFLESACGDDKELLKELQSLLQAAADAHFLDQPVARPPPGFGFKIPARLDQFRIDAKPLGQGGMGVVYKAFDTRLEREVALKIILPDFRTDAIRQRFLQEAKTLSKLDHPHICTLFDIQETDGLLYLVMAYYQGETLKDRLERGRILLNDALDIAIEVAGALSEAHANNILHRDIKPANIMLTPKLGVKLLDFGIAKIADVNLTATGVMPGTPAYMAPEQLISGKVDGRSDIWALGVVIYEMLSGQRPFQLTNPLVLSESIFDLAALDLSALPPAMEKIIAKSLAFDPNHRYQRAEQLLKDLLALKAGLEQERLQAAEQTTIELPLKKPEQPQPAVEEELAPAAVSQPLPRLPASPISSWSAVLGASLIGISIVILLALTSIDTRLDNFAVDTLFVVRGPLAMPKPVVIVKIDDESLTELNKPWPWPRDLHAQLLEQLFAAGAVAVVFDILFAEPASAPETDSVFAATLQRYADKVVLASQFQDKNTVLGPQRSWIEPLPEFRTTAVTLGFSNLIQRFGTVRTLIPKLADQPSLSYAAARLFSADFPDQYVWNNEYDRIARLTINFAGPAGTFPSASYYQALEPKKFLPEDYFRNKLVFVGATTNISGGDAFQTPYTQSGDATMYGVEIHASAAYNMLYANDLKRPAPGLVILVSLILTIIASWLFCRWRPLNGALVLLAGIILAAAAAFVLFAYFAYWLPLGSVLPPLLIVYLSAMLIHYQNIYRSEKRIGAILQNQSLSLNSGSAALRGSAALPQPVRIYLSYDVKDKEYQYVSSILEHLSGLNREDVEFWSKQQLVTGDSSTAMIKDRIARADLALVLINQTLLDSDQFNALELPEIARHDLLILPFILSPCEWQHHDWLRDKKILPDGRHTFAHYFSDSLQRDQQLLNLRQDLRKQIERLRR